MTTRSEIEHGTRKRYCQSKCRCVLCRAANAAYYHKRKKWVRGLAEPPLADAEEVTRHLRGLRSKGIGERTVEEITGLARSSIHKILTGETRRVKPETALVILGLDADDLDRLPAGLLISAKPTWKRIERMMDKGWSRTRIARALGYKGREIQLDRKRVSVENARRVRDLYALHFGIRCALCGEPLAFHSLLEPCWKGGDRGSSRSAGAAVRVGRVVPLG